MASTTTTPPEFPQHLLIEKPPFAPGIRRVPVDRYFKQSFHDREVERIWKKAWQWACRAEQIPEVGDFTVYEVADLSFIVVRTGPDSFKAFYNSCPHRGRKICTFDGKRATELRCMFHGWTWNLDGSMKEMTGGWDFRGVRNEEVRLGEVKVDCWGGYVFINPDPDCEPLAEFLGELPNHFEGAGHDLSKRWTQVHVVAHVPANWKVVQEAFLEPWHLATTHPQLLGPPGEGPTHNGRWDDFGNFMRVAYGLPDEKKPGYMPRADNAQQYLDQQYDVHMNEESTIKAIPGDDGMSVMQRTMREAQRMAIGDAVDAIHDYHMNPGELLSLWPNFHPWQGFTRLMYRFRPYRGDPDTSLMDVLLLAPWPEDKPMPPPAEPHFIALGQPITDAKELGNLARIFAQDLGNIPMVHQGMKTSRSGYVILSDHNEAPLRRWHAQYDRWMGLDDADPAAAGIAP